MLSEPRYTFPGDAGGDVEQELVFCFFDLSASADLAHERGQPTQRIRVFSPVLSGGLLDPPFELEVEGRRAALREYRARPVHGRRSNYFNALPRVEDAGFLEEYVWHYLHRDAWGATPPAALTLGVFEEYRERELTSHTVQSGSRVRIHAVRTLPLAAYVTSKK